MTRLEYLFELSVNQLASSEELAELMVLPENESLAKELLLKAYERPKELVDVDEVKREAILAAIYQTQIPKTSPEIFSLHVQWMKWTAVAAVILITVSVGSYIFFDKTKPVQPQLAAVLKTDDLRPGENRAILTLANGAKISLADSLSAEVVKQSGMQITKAANGQLIYKISSPSTALANSNTAYNTIETPKGGQYQVLLPDGTKVWLNASSSLRYPVPFSVKERSVVLTGEAYFEVEKDKNRPFRVLSKTQVVEVLGTHFNVNAYADEQAVKTTLLEGAVKVQSLGLKVAKVLKPNQQAVLNTEGLSICEADTEMAVAWKNGYFRFNGEAIESIMRKVSRWYDVEVEFKGVISNERFNGTVSSNKNINQVLEMLETTNAVHFKIEGRRIIVMK